MGFYRLEFRRGKAKTAKVYQGQAPARITTAINRYNCGMTVGSGWYSRFTHQDPVGSTCGVLGWFDDGRVNVALPVGGCGLLGRADVEIAEWPDYVTDEQRASWDHLPKLSLVRDGEIQSA